MKLSPKQPLLLFGLLSICLLIGDQHAAAAVSGRLLGKRAASAGADDEVSGVASAALEKQPIQARGAKFPTVKKDLNKSATTAAATAAAEGPEEEATAAEDESGSAADEATTTTTTSSPSTKQQNDDDAKSRSDGLDDDEKEEKSGSRASATAEEQSRLGLASDGEKKKKGASSKSSSSPSTAAPESSDTKSSDSGDDDDEEESATKKPAKQTDGKERSGLIHDIINNIIKGKSQGGDANDDNKGDDDDDNDDDDSKSKQHDGASRSDVDIAEHSGSGLEAPTVILTIKGNPVTTKRPKKGKIPTAAAAVPSTTTTTRAPVAAPTSTRAPAEAPVSSLPPSAEQPSSLPPSSPSPSPSLPSKPATTKRGRKVALSKESVSIKKSHKLSKHKTKKYLTISELIDLGGTTSKAPSLVKGPKAAAVSSVVVAGSTGEGPPAVIAVKTTKTPLKPATTLRPAGKATTAAPPTTKVAPPAVVLKVSTVAPKAAVVVVPPKATTIVPKATTIAPKAIVVAPTAATGKPDAYSDFKDSDKLLAVVITKKGGFKGRRLTAKAAMAAIMKGRGLTDVQANKPISVSAENTFVFPAGHYYFPQPVRMAGFTSP